MGDRCACGQYRDVCSPDGHAVEELPPKSKKKWWHPRSSEDAPMYDYGGEIRILTRRAWAEGYNAAVNAYAYELTENQHMEGLT